ncbi:MAG: CatB-related O-acetyltransferase [Schwartzia sp.]|nr:CatB-related O-acetyltransferase [Schwartzia sp. (in: firmicutes)]
MNYDERYILICEAIETALQKGKRDFIIYPFGMNGMMTKNILNERYLIQEKYILDNKLCAFRPDIKSVAEIKSLDTKNCTLLLTIENPKFYDEVLAAVKPHFSDEDIAEIFVKAQVPKPPLPKVGKYSYGPLTTNPYVKEVGAFCSFAFGTNVVTNHTRYCITTHPMTYVGTGIHELFTPPLTYDMQKDSPWYFPGITPKGKSHKYRRITIGNDVWLGHNVIITNYANIGDGVIAGAGAVITKDVPDYAIVAGVPARIIGYRFTSEQIKALKEIAWWDWSDDKIRENYDDFFLSADEFIHKHLA